MPPAIGIQVPPPPLPMKSEPRGVLHASLRSASLRSLECNRQELMQPWDVTRPDPEDEDDIRSKKKSTKKMDPPARNSHQERRKCGRPATASIPSKPDPIARMTKKMTSSRIHPESTAVAAAGYASRSKARENLIRRVQAESQKVMDETTRRLSKSQSSSGLYEEFPTKKPSRKSSDEHHHSSLSCSISSINRDEHGLFLEEVDWNNTSIDWGDDYDLEVIEPTIEKKKRNIRASGRRRNERQGLFDRKGTVD